MGAAAPTDCRDLYNTQEIFKPPSPFGHNRRNALDLRKPSVHKNVGKWNFHFTTFSLTEGRRWSKPLQQIWHRRQGGYASRSGAGTTAFLRALLPKVQSSSLLQASSELGERRYNSGYLNYKGGHLRYNSAPESYKSGHSFYKTAVQATETPELCPVFNGKGQRGKITLWKTNALRTPHRSSQRVQEFSYYMPQMLAFVSIFFSTTQENSSFFKNVIFRNVKFWQVFYYAPFSAPVCVTAPQINGEGTETLCTAFLYKNRKITSPKTKRFKRAFPFVLRGLAIFMYVDRVV